jgi:hypothetical protein
MKHIGFQLLHAFCLLIPCFVLPHAPCTCIAGSYIIANEYNRQIVTHPGEYSGSGGQLVISVGVNPLSPYAEQMIPCIQNVIATLNLLTPATGNLVSSNGNDIPSNTVDFESVLLHEMGHALGLNHPNLGSESGMTGENRDFARSTRGDNGVFDLNVGADGIRGSGDDPRGDDDNLTWFFIASNNPFEIEPIVDRNTFSRVLDDLPGGDQFATCAGRAVSPPYGIAATEAVMFQGTYLDEAQRVLAADDVATFRYAMTGLDDIEGTSDDYAVELRYAGYTRNADIVIHFDDAETGFALTEVQAWYLSANHVSITRADIYFNTQYNWFFNGLNPSVAPTITGQRTVITAENTPVTITLDDLIVFDPDNSYPEDFTLSLQDGPNYIQSVNLVDPSANFLGLLYVPVRVSDGHTDSNIFNLNVFVTRCIHVEPNLSCNGNPNCFSGIGEAISAADPLEPTTIKVAGAKTPYRETVIVNKDIFVDIGLDSRNFQDASPVPADIGGDLGSPALIISSGMAICHNARLR